MIFYKILFAANNAGLPEVTADKANLDKFFTIIFGTIAAVAVVVIMISAINYATADSDADKISRSKKAIIYALIGVCIAVTAEMIVLTVLGKF